MKEIFNHSLIRITGLPFERLRFSTPKMVEMAAILNNEDTMVYQIAQNLCADLHHFNQSISDGHLQKKIQNVRRLIYNRKPLRENDRSILASLPAPLATQATDYFNREKALATNRQQLFDSIAILFIEERQALQAAANNELLLKAISLASHSLYHDIGKYISKDCRTFKSGEIHTEKSLLKYLTRTCAKTSPFSTLTSLSMVPLAVDKGNAAVFMQPATKAAPTTFVRINNILLAFWKRLIASDRTVAIYFPIYLNPTITVTNNTIVFLINKSNVDFFQRIPLSPVLTFIMETLRNKAGFSIDALVTELESHIDADREGITHYLFSCVESGLIEIDFLVTGIDPNWNTTLLERWGPYAQKLESSNVAIICQALTAINALCKVYATGNSAERIDLGKAAFSIAEKASLDIWKYNNIQKAQRLQKEPSPITDFVMALRPENLFMEDSKQNLPIVLSTPAMNTLMGKLADFYRQMDFFEGKKGEQLRMYAYFTKKYPGQSSVPLLLFYEDYYKDIRLREKAFNELPPGKLPPGFELLKHVSDVKKTNRDGLTKQWVDLLLAKASFSNDQSVVTFTLRDIQEANQALGTKPDLSKKHSVGAFVQCAFAGTEGEQQCTGMVVNSLSAAYGKMFSRFLYLFDDALTEDVKESIMQCVPTNSVFAELQDASYHNANLHPTLMSHEIRIPGGHISLPPDHQLHISSLRVTIKEEQKRLELVDAPSGKTVWPFDLGFQAPNGRSELFQLLCIFSYADYTSPQILATYINNKVLAEQDKDRQYMILPRIVFEDNIVFQRKAWKVALAQIPTKRNDEDFGAYYVRLIAWKNNLQIPDLVFVRAVEKSKRIELVEGGKAGRDDYKPQYVDFNSPLLVTLFDKLLTKADNTVFIEEMYPLPEAQLCIKGERYVTEFYLQMNDYGTAG